MIRLKKQIVCAVILSGLLPWRAGALDESNLLFHATFDNGFDADFAGGQKTATVEGDVERVPNQDAEDLSGRNGTSAVKCTSKGDLLRYALAGNVHLPQGAVSLWVYELDTDKDQRVWNPLFQVVGENEVLNILRLWQPIQYAGGLWRSNRKVAFAGGAVAERGTWAHVLYTWRKHEMAMYVNGKGGKVSNVDFLFLNPQDSFTLGRPKNPTKNADDFHSGEHMLKDAPETAKEMKIGTEPYGAYLLDDVAVFNTYLSETEAKTLFEKSLTEALQDGVVGTPTLDILNYASSARVRVDAHFFEPLPADAKVVARVVRKDGSSAGISTPVERIAGGLEYAYLDVAELAPGAYDVVVVATVGEQETARTPTAEFERIEAEEWMGNTYGEADVVLPGFEPLEAEGAVVSLWERTYDFTNSLMPAQVTNQGTDMLARPVNWYAHIDGEELALTTDSMDLVSSSDTRARYEGRGSLGPFAVVVRLMVEYDGFMKVDIAFDPGAAAVEIERLWMDIPLVPTASTSLFHPTRRSGSWTDNFKSDLKLCYTNIITLGTPDMSLQWMTESDQYYYPRGYDEAVCTLAEDGARVFRNNVIGAAKSVDEPFALTFALHAGPVRPRPADWRGWTMRGRLYLDPDKHTSVQYTYDWWARTPGSLIPRKGFPQEPKPNLYKGDIRMTSMHFAGFRHFEETDPQKRLPVWKKYEAEWERIPRQIRVGHTPGWNEQYVDTNSTWGDWHIYNCHRLFKLTGMQGLYYDDWIPRPTQNEAAGSGYVDENGIRRPINPIFSQREIHRRVYAIVKKFRPDDGIVIIHTASTIILPIVSFCDIIYDGEILGWIDLVPPEGDYFKTFRNDLFQTIFSCKQYGPVPGFHDMTGPNAGKEKCGGRIYAMGNQRKLWSKLLLHDIHAQGGFTSGSENLRYFWLDHFGIADRDVTFHPYWGEDPAVRAVKGYWGHGPDRASKYWAVAYSKPDEGKVLVVVVRDAPNNYSGNVTVDVTLDRERLGLPSGSLKCSNLESLCRTTLGRVDGDTLKVPVGVDNFVAVVLEKE